MSVVSSRTTTNPGAMPLHRTLSLVNHVSAMGMLLPASTMHPWTLFQKVMNLEGVEYVKIVKTIQVSEKKFGS